MYRNAYQQHSNTSFESDVDDDDDKALENALDDIPDRPVVVVPAQWSARHSHSRSVSLARGPISSLPPELLIHILRHLHVPRDLFHCLLVSRDWCQCSVELLWHKPVFTKFETLSKMTRLLASSNQSFTYASFIRRLNFLSLGKVLRDDSFSTIAHCTRLERLTLVNCDHLSGNTLTAVLPSFPNLIAVDLSGVSHTTDAAIVGLASSARRLQGVNMAGCKHVTDTAILALARYCPSLRRVKLSGVSLITDESVSALAKGCPLLLEIDLNKCSLITDISVRDIWTHSTHMREMRLSHLPELSETAYPSSLPSDVTQEGNNPFSSSRVRLHDDQLPPLIISRNFEHLRMLDLTACALVTDDAVEGIISHAPKIRNLMLSKCSLLTDRAVESICKLGRHLHYLHLGHASRITDKSVRNLARSCTRLRYVDFANCTLLTDLSVHELAGLGKLRRIGLVRVNRLTDEAIYSLAKRHNTLERIHLSYCDQISVMAIHFLLQKLHKLTHLSLTGVPAFRQQELQQFCREPPKEFNEQQQAAFCVYSGKGVLQLRAFLMDLFDHITEMNGTDDTEFEEDDTDPEGPEDEVELPSSYAHLEDSDDVSYRIMRHLSIPQYQHAYDRTSHGRHDYNFGLTSDDGSSTIHGTVHRAEAPIASTSSAAAGPSRRLRGPHPSQAGSRTVADALPVVESYSPPPASDIASHRSSNQSNGSGVGFFRTYQDAVGNTSTQSNGARTPDLNFAEIGHGRGAFYMSNVPAPLQMRRETSQRPHPRSRQPSSPLLDAGSHSHTAAGPSHSHPSSSTSLATSHPSSHESPGPTWPYEEPASPVQSSSSPRNHPNTVPPNHSPSSSPSTVPGGHSSSRRATIRNTLTTIFRHGHHEAGSANGPNAGRQ